MLDSNASPTPIRLLVVDDHPVVRDGLKLILGTQPDFEVVAAVGDGRAALEQARRLRPAVVLLDLEMPGADGVAVLQALRAELPGIRVLVFTAFDTDDRILAAVRAGAQGYLLKGAPREELFNAIRVVHSGGSLLQPVVASRLLRRMSEDPPESRATPRASAGGDARPLPTPREMEVLALLARGLQNKEIARELVISERTVKFHVSSLMAKLEAGNRTEVVSVAAQRGLIKL